MNPAHLHLMLNHIPVLGVPFVLLILLIGIKKADLGLYKLAYSLMLLITVLTVPAYLTGEPAEEMIEHRPGISENIIEEHEEGAAVAFALVCVCGVLAAVALSGRIPKGLEDRVPKLLVAALLLTAASLAVTANKGGQISHPEIRGSDVPTGSYRDDD